jgi:hypothetical protein
MKYLGLHNKPKAVMHLEHLLIGPLEEEEEEEKGGEGRGGGEGTEGGGGGEEETPMLRFQVLWVVTLSARVIDT